MKNKLTFLFDGGCPLCLRETNFLKKRDTLNQIAFIDINSKDYDQSLFNDISYSEAMSNLHVIIENGEIIKGLDVLAYSYELVGLGWVYYPLKIKLLSPLLRLVTDIGQNIDFKLQADPILKNFVPHNVNNKYGKYRYRQNNRNVLGR